MAHDSGEAEGPGEPHRRPAWMTAFLIVGLVVAVLFVVSLLLGQGHGPGRHG